MVHLNPFHENKSKAPVPPNMEREAHNAPVDVLHGPSVHRRGARKYDSSNMKESDLPASPPEFPPRLHVAVSKAQTLRAKPGRRRSSFSFSALGRRLNRSPTDVMPRNPFADAEATGETPSTALKTDPLLEVMENMQSVMAEQKPRVSNSSGVTKAFPEKGEIIDPRYQQGNRSESGIPRTTFSQAKAFFLKPERRLTSTNKNSISTRQRSENDGEVQATELMPVDHLNVDIPHVNFGTGTFQWFSEQSEH